MPQTRLLLIRHAATDANGRRLAGRASGVHLDAEGQRQARALAVRLAQIRVAALYCSPLERATETAQPLAQALGLGVTTREAFLEIDFGHWSGRGFDELAGTPEFRRFNDFRSCAPVPGGESMLQAQARMLAGLDGVCAAHPGETAAVVSHGDLIKAAIAYYAGIPLDLFQRLEIGLGSVSIVDLDDRAPRILVVNGGGELADLPPLRTADGATRA
jgi:probable phosphomutase (TIGR03848 family)